MWTAANTYKTIYMVHTELFGKKSRTFQGLKSFFQGLLFPNNTKHLFWMKIIFIQAAFNNIQRLLWKIQGLFKDIPLFFNFQGLLKDMTLFQGPCEPWIQLILYYCEEDYTVLIRKPQVTFGGGGTPLHPPPTSAPVKLPILTFNRTYSKCRDQPGVQWSMSNASMTYPTTWQKIL